MTASNKYLANTPPSGLPSSPASARHHLPPAPLPLPSALQSLLRQYWYFCTSKTSKVSTSPAPLPLSSSPTSPELVLLHQYLYFCTSKASKLSRLLLYCCCCFTAAAALLLDRGSPTAALLLGSPADVLLPHCFLLVSGTTSVQAVRTSDCLLLLFHYCFTADLLLLYCAGRAART